MKDYLEFFGFNDDPFKLTPDPRYFFLSESHQEALSSLKYLLESEEGFGVIVGEPGTGKTLTVRKFVEELPSEEVRFAYILFPNLSSEELFEAILEDFSIRSEGETKNRLFAKLRDFLISEREKGKKVFIIIDEAQNLPTKTLEELRILSNLETSDTKLLQIILIGQPELEDKLNSLELRQLRQRITVFVKLRSFTEEETKAYIDFRISKAGRGNLKIDTEVYKLVHKLSLGTPRLINMIMERSLMAAFVDSSHEIRPRHVEKAAESLGLTLSRRSVPMVVLYAAVFLLLIASALFFGATTFLKVKTVEKNEVPVEEAKEEPSPEEEEEKERVVFVSVPMLHMREAPSKDAGIVYLLREGDRLKVLEEGPETWIRVLYSEGDVEVEGWVNGKYVR